MLPPRMLWSVAALPLVLLSPLRSVRQDAQPAKLPHLVFSQSPAIDLYFYVRSVATAGTTSRIEELKPAVTAAKELERMLGGSPLAWGPLEGLLPGCNTAADVEKAFARAPETVELRPGSSVKLREGGLALAAALVKAEPAFQEPSKKREARVAAARARWDADVAPKLDALLEFHMKSLGMKPLELEIPVCLVAEAPPPGAVTHRGELGTGVCFVAVDPLPGSQLYECILHECTHALDISTTNSVLDDLRQRLELAGIQPSEKIYRDLPHTLMFVQAAESIRRVIDPKHVDYGEQSKYYQRAGPSSEPVRGFWHDYLEGKIGRSAALDGIVASAKPAPK